MHKSAIMINNQASKLGLQKISLSAVFALIPWEIRSDIICTLLKYTKIEALRVEENCIDSLTSSMKAQVQNPWNTSMSLV